MRLKPAVKLAALGCLLIVISRPVSAAPRNQKPPITPKWAFGLWVWEDDKNTAAEARSLVNGFLEHDIPVSAVILDSPWSVEYNDFNWDPDLYPDPKGFVDEMHSKGVKVLLWTTCNINKFTRKSGDKEISKLYEEGLAKGYFCNDGKTTKWWKGDGAYIDYTNPDAVKWWHGLLDKVLNIGIDGWKADGTDAMFPNNGHCKSGPVNTRKYMDMYSADMYDYTVSRNPNAAIMIRSVDNRIVQPKGFSLIEKANVTWVGDQQAEWGPEGFAEALDNIFYAMKLGYAVIGSDGAAYQPGESTVNGMIDKHILIRWTQFAALNTFYEFGGHNERRVWLYGDDALNIFRYFAKMHYELIPFLYSLTANAHFEGGQVMSPAQGKWQYTIGKDIFVSVIYEDSATREVKLPAGKWIDYWSDEEYKGDTTIKDYPVPMDRYPIFIRKGAVIPLEVVDDATGRGTKASKGLLTLDIYPDRDENSEFKVYDENLKTMQVKTELSPREFSAFIRDCNNDLMLRVRLESEPGSVTVNQKEAAKVKDLDELASVDQGWTIQRGRTWIKSKQRGEVNIKVNFK